METNDQRRGSEAQERLKLFIPVFNLVIDDGRTATYRAYLGGESSLFALTVVVSSPANRVDRKQLQDFLRKMEAGFQIVDAGPGQAPPANDHIPFDPRNDVLIIAELVLHPHGSPNGVRFAVKGTAPGAGAPHTAAYGGNLGMEDASGPIGHKDLLFLAAGHKKQQSTVSCDEGSLTLVHPKRTNPIVAGQSGIDLPGMRYIKMHGNKKDNEYYIDGKFSLA